MQTKRSRLVAACKDQTQMRSMTGLKGQTMSVSFLKTERMPGWLEHEERARMFGV